MMEGFSGSLIKGLKQPSSKNLVFTSAGDRSSIAHWLEGSHDFDLWVCYYGDGQTDYTSTADYYVRRKGGKFPNLKFCFDTWRSIFSQYDAIMVADDDIIISGKELTGLFRVREEFDLYVMQPAFDLRGKISHRITREQSFSRLRYTNFVEVTCPLFRADKLFEFLAVYDPDLVCWGVDWWFSEIVGKGTQQRIAIVDEISCVNPLDSSKGGREIDIVQNDDQRIANWNRFKARLNLSAEDAGFVTFGKVPAVPSLRMIIRAFKRAFFKRFLHAK